MKKNILLTAILSIALASCQSEDNLEQSLSEIQLTSVVNPMSRATSLTQQSTQIVSGQEVGVTIIGAKESHTNVKWIAGKDGALTNTGEIIYWANTEATIHAYHPYNSIWSGSDKMESFSVNTDQSTDAGYLNSDLLWTTKTGTKSTNPVELSFVHKLSKINVTLTSEDVTDLSGANISICGTKTSTSFNPFTGELSSASNVANIKAGVTTSEAYTASAIIIPQTITSGTQLIKVTHNNKNFYYKLSADKEFKAGHSYSYTLKVKEKQEEVELESGNITDWTDEDATGDAEEEVAIPYLTFTANAEQTLTMSKSVATLEYSVNDGEWNTLGTTTVTFGGNNGDLRLRGKSSIGTSAAVEDYNNYSTILFGSSTPVACSGDIRTLIDYENYTTTSTENARFRYLFKNCTSLTTAPELPAETLANTCYAYMFYNCSNLIEAPQLPAKIVPTAGYYHMFEKCSNLRTAPELSAMTVGNAGYNTMFAECTSLVNAPELPATTLIGENHYACMFMNCTSLKNTPKILPSMTATMNCYANMFDGCVNITSAPELPATTLHDWCYDYMFKGCVNLINVPAELPAPKVSVICYRYMFSGCVNLKKAPRLPATELAQHCYLGMFGGCTSLETAPRLPAAELAEGCYLGMFEGCTSLKKAPKLEAKTLVSQCYLGMFQGCSNLNEITMLATDITAYYCLNQWVKDVASIGTFYKAASMKSLIQDDYDYDGIPIGDWIVKNYGEE